MNQTVITTTQPTTQATPQPTPQPTPLPSATPTPSPALLAISPATASVAPNGVVTFSGTGGTPAYTFAVTTNRSGAQVDASSGLYHAGQTGDVADIVSMSDRSGTTASVIVNVGPSIVLAPASATLPPRGTVTFAATRGAGGFTYSLTTDRSGASIDPVSGVYVAGPNANVTDVVKVTDRLGSSITAEVNVGPSIGVTPQTATVAPNGALTFSASRGSGTGYVFSLANNLSGATIDPHSGAYVAGPAANVTDVIQVTDDRGNSVTADVNVGPAVSITPQTATVAPNGRLTFLARGGSAGYVFVLSTNLSGATVNPTTGAYVAGGTENVADVVQVTDSLGNSTTAEVNVGPTVRLTPQSTTIAPNGTVSFKASLGSGLGYVYSLSTNLSGATIDPSTGAYNAGATGDVIDVVEVADSLGNTTTAIVNVGPVVAITPDGPSVAQRGTIHFTGTGGSGSGFAWSLSSNLSGGTIDASTGAYVAGSTGPVTDVVELTDSLGNSTTTLVSVGASPFTVTAGAHVLDTDADTYDGNPVTGLSGGRWVVGTFNVVAGATLTVSGSRALVISSTDSVQVDGAILARGGDGQNARSQVPGSGGAAGVGGSAGGKGGFAPPDGAVRGAGPGGGGPGALVVSNQTCGGGGGGGHASAGQPGGGVGGGAAGASYGANDIPFVLVGGSGGGGGARLPGFSAGGGGGGGGGVVRIVATGTIIISATATVDVRGGAGGNGFTPSGGNAASGGGGGSGGSVWLTASVSPTLNGTILLSGGSGGLGVVAPGAPATSGDGGAGSSGTLVLDVIVLQ